MCDRLVRFGPHGYEHYICNDCFEELRQFKETWPSSMKANEVGERIEQFMDTEVGTYSELNQVEIDDMFDRLTGDSWYDES